MELKRVAITELKKIQNVLASMEMSHFTTFHPHPHLEFSSTNKEDVGANARDLRSDSDHCHGAEAEGEGCPIEVGFTFLLSGSLPQLRAGLTVREEAQFTSLLW